MQDSYDIIVIGGGHAGTEAAWAASSVLATRGGRGRVALITMDPARIGQMSCNPAIGGLGKGQMVREIDALGGMMGLAIDATGIMFKMLNTSKGAAVRGPRAQADKYAYAAEIQRLVASRSNLDVIAGTIDDLIVEDGRVIGVTIPAGAGIVSPDPDAIEHNLRGDSQAKPVYPSHPRDVEALRAPRTIRSDAVVLTTGTFARGLMHTGETRTAGGRVDEGAAQGISNTLRRLGFELGRLKTGTPPRLAQESIAWDELDAQVGDERPVPFSDLSARNDDPGEARGKPALRNGVIEGWLHESVVPSMRRFPVLPQTECRITQTTAQAHELIRANLHRAPMFSGQVDAECGPRYCPSIEDKIVRFADRESHHVFLEPESLYTNEIYCNGISTSLPVDVQETMVRSMPGCAEAVILKWGYAVEYDMVWPHQIDATCMTKRVRGLFLAGQINCTTGYEEAGSQGLVAGLNAARLVMGEDAVRLARDEGYIGVMMDDLVTKTPREPYRMFTSRAEHRLRLRAENADERLTPLGRELGLVDDVRWSAYEERAAHLQALRNAFDRIHVEGKSLRALARRPDASVSSIRTHLERDEIAASARTNGSKANESGSGRLPVTADLPGELLERVMTEAKYDGYLARQQAEIKRQRAADHQKIPDWFEPWTAKGLRAEAAETLQKYRPATMGQAARLPGVNPADLTILAVAIRRGPQRTSAPIA
ncbi:MAG: tRNA uridine-5-carboxymethylaminomethyl(34) synthesis enzyme MnmG [Phycisphaerales bacterium]|nr:MAG: tRNA uridine-5-carboxymethylaminomethyl(34) synthesis enzyme MnmG [Phycisphaerales bacterium]